MGVAVEALTPIRLIAFLSTNLEHIIFNSPRYFSSIS